VKLVIVGARADGLAHGVLDLLAVSGEHEAVAFLDDTPALQGTEVLGLPVLGPAAEIGRAQALGAEGAVIAIGAPRARERLGALIRDAGLGLPPLVHPSA